jgi:hypothetical protein
MRFSLDIAQSPKAAFDDRANGERPGPCAATT